LKTSFFVFLLLLISVWSRANLVENKSYTINQPDSSKYEAFVSGDEYYHRVHDKEGYTILQNPKSGYAVYAVPDGKTIKASEYVVGKVNPASLGIRPNLMKQDPAIEQRFQEQQRLLRDGNRASPNGIVNNIVVFVRFADQQEYMSASYSDYDDEFNSNSTRSLHNFYDVQSNGQLDIESFLYPQPDANGYIVSVQVPQNRGYFSPYNANSNPGGYPDDEQETLRTQLLTYELIALTLPYMPSN